MTSIRIRVARVMALVRETGQPEPSGVALHIRGAIDDTFERMAKDLLESTDAQRTEMGLSERDHEKEVAVYLQYATAEALLSAQGEHTA